MRSVLIVGMGILSLAMFGGTVSAAVIHWNMGVDLSDSSQSAPMTKSEDGYGDFAAGDFGSPKYAGINPYGPYFFSTYARFVDTGSHGNDGFTFQNGVDATIGQAFTIDMIVRGEDALNSTGRSASIRVGNNGGTSSGQIGIEPGSVYGDGSYGGGDSLWITIRNGGYVPYGFLFQKTTDAYGWRHIRLVSPGDGTLLVYDHVYDSNTFTLVGTATDMPAGASVSALGFSLNSISGGTVTSSGFSLLGLAMDTTNALGGDDASMLIWPEPASVLLFVVFGGLTLLRRRS